MGNPTPRLSLLTFSVKDYEGSKTAFRNYEKRNFILVSEDEWMARELIYVYVYQHTHNGYRGGYPRI